MRKSLKNEYLWEDGASLLLFDLIKETLVDFSAFSDFFRVSGLIGFMTLSADLTSDLGEDP